MVARDRKHAMGDAGPSTKYRWTAGPSSTSLWCRPSLGTWELWPLLGVATLVAVMLSGFLVLETGGTMYVYPYTMLFPVIFAGAIFKVPGGVIVGALGAMILGPYMPLNVEAGIMQTTGNWLVRLGMYILIGAFSGALGTILDFWHRNALAHERVDFASGLISRMAAESILRNARSKNALGYAPRYAVAVGFDGYYNVVLALGIGMGTNVIRRLGDAMAALCGNDVLVTRIHGATFCALLPDVRTDVTAFLAACQHHIPRTFRVQGVPITMLPRFGIAELEPDEDLLGGKPFRKSLVALRIAQQEKRQVSRYDNTSDSDARDNLGLLSDFRSDLEQGLCEVHFQPKLDLRTNRVFGVEALLRWHSKKRGPVSPGRFVPVVENTLLIDSLTRFVVEQSARTLLKWDRQGLGIGIAINMSVRNLEDDAFVKYLSEVPENFGVRASSIELELTETAMTQSLAVARVALGRLREAGFKVAIDDFGTGYSSFAYLKNLPIDWVKLDQSFVQDLPDNTESREISSATAAMCQRLGYKVIAEGVETEKSESFLRGQQFDAIQGYHLGKPMPAEAFQTWLARRKSS